MKNILLLTLLLTALFLGCKHEASEEVSRTAAITPSGDHKQVSAIKLLYGPEQAVVKAYLDEVDPIDGSIIDEVKAPVSKVGIVYMEQTPTRENLKLTGVSAPTELEALLSRDTLYLKFFERSKFTEGGIRVKAFGSNFNMSYYLVKDGGEIYHPEMLTPQPNTVVEDYVSGFIPQKQSLSLNKKTYEVGDTIFGEMYYEGRQNSLILYAKGTFRGIIREGK